MWLSSVFLFIFINAVISENQPGCPANFIGPKCEIPVCNRLNGQLVYRSPDDYFCKCDDGFVGTHCETIICQNNGILKGAECDCSNTGFTGRFCNVESAPEPVNKDGKYFFTWVLVIYAFAVVFFFIFVYDTRYKAAKFVDKPYSASRKASKLYILFYYTFISKDVKLW